MRKRLAEALKDAMKSKDQTRLSTLRLINAAIKDREIAARGTDRAEDVTDADITAILGKMIKQRNDSVQAYEEGGRLELAERERAEIGVIQEFLPKQMSDAEVATAITTAIDKTGAASIRDMGRVMAHLKGAHAGQMDFSKVGPQVKDALG